MEKIKKNAITIDQKKGIIDNFAAEIAYDKIKEKYKLKSSANICTIYAKREKYLAAYRNVNASPLRKTLKTTKFETIDKNLKNFVLNCAKDGVTINDVILKTRALEIANDLKIENFKSSNGYIEKFKKRNCIFFKTIHGDASAVDENVIERWFSTQLKEIIHLIDPVNIPNGDDLGLFWRVQASATYTVKDTVCKLGKQSKERMTIFVAANMDGTDKIPLVIIGISTST